MQFKKTLLEEEKNKVIKKDNKVIQFFLIVPTYELRPNENELGLENLISKKENLTTDKLISCFSDIIRLYYILSKPELLISCLLNRFLCKT